MLVIAVILFVLAAVLLVLSVMHFLQKGFLLNNAYIYASKAERQTMNKAPHYRQSAIVLLLIALLDVLLGISVLTQSDNLLRLAAPLALGTIVYALVSSARIERKQK